ncbi:restriction endonuclease subunit S [Ruegeria sp. SCSIO 43209]|uniref:restriction endonuclease subunit S n=1 Tax=Ruegeria sp. SCSIO 43209 TaxID=2793010 RepID=UPI001CA887D6|nr:restriction endonuclease subunit S [Ruegeria sp. SCSIO 43209]UAB88704.1 restriction endonuclease subunit S [Ruegeria sp. SCSIO 43209]
MNLVPLGDLMPSRIPSVNPAKHPDEVFELWSIPAFDVGKPDIVSGSKIGSSKKCVEPGDVLLSRIVPHIRRSWVVRPSTSNRQIASGEWITFRGLDFDPNYLRHILTSDPFHAEFMKTVAGVGGSLLRARPESVKAIKIPFPPLEEQKRIAGILDQAASLCRLRTHALDKLNTLGQAIFHEMFGDPVSNPHKYPIVALEDLCQVISDCLHKTPKHLENSTSGYPSIRSSDLISGNIDFSTTKHVDETTYVERIGRHRPVAGDVVYCREGARYGNCGIVPEGVDLCLGQRTMLFQAKEGYVAPYYLWFVVRSDWVKHQADRVVGGAASPHVNIRDIRKFPCLLPPLRQQERFAQSIAEIYQTRQRLLTSQDESETLFASLQHRVFHGEL